ncbi:MAG: DUF2723 domain-containing protein [Bacteroidetes bacterium]|nr:DUF2723 domain-containing protein [Bacteroidota bacterium]
MMQLELRRSERLLSWGVFFVALMVYALTVEPTSSFWDAGEYISTSAKLQVGHPPGAPLFQLIGAFFASFAFANPLKIALMVNCVSVVSSAFTIFFTFKIISNLGEKWVRSRFKNKAKEEALDQASIIAILGASLVGALTLCFSDSFWFNAVETEVYAMASLVISLLLWLGILWTDRLSEPQGDRYLVLIAFVIGLVFGIQFMGFLAIPSIGLLYYFKKTERITPKNFVLANIGVVALLFLVYRFSLTYILKLFGATEVFFVNEIGLPFNSGSIITAVAISALLLYIIQLSKKRQLANLHLTAHMVLFLILGFSTWLLLPIRANAQTVVNENNPEDARALLAYYNREQYPAPESPFYGSYYSDYFATAGPDQDGTPKYEKNEKLRRYEIVNNYKDALQGPNPNHVGLLPRMWSASSAENYMRYYGRLDFSINPRYQGDAELRNAVAQFKQMSSEGEIDTAQYLDFLKNFAEYIEVKPPTFGQNMSYLIDFQFNYMYWRYFFWNFVGRQNDEQGRFNANGEWLSGITFIDSVHLGNQSNLPDDLLNNKARNTYFFLPLLLGLIGIYYHARHQWKSFYVLLVYFLFTGLAIQFYTNPTIFQPRERDYSLVGSFFIFSLWVGFGALALFDLVASTTKQRTTELALGTTAMCLLAVPLLMAFENWDDHDRSTRKTARSTAMAYLDSCAEDQGSLLFTIGDNDTFPLWYMQEIEGYRTDVRVVNSSLLATDWYIDQMKRKAYESDPIPSQLSHNQYRFGTRDVIYYQPVPELAEERWELSRFMDWVSSGKPETKLSYLMRQQGADMSDFKEEQLDIVYYPTHKIRVPVDKNAVLKSGIVSAKDSTLIVDHIDIDLPKSALPKNRLLMLDMLHTNNWERPIYFSGGSLDSGEYLYMKDYLQLDGLVYKLVPIFSKDSGAFDMGRIDTELMYSIVMDWEWGNSEDPSVYIDPQTRAQGISFRSNMARLVEQLIAEQQFEKAEEVIDRAVEKMPISAFKFYAFVEPFIQGYYAVSAVEKAQKLSAELLTLYLDHLAYYTTLDAEESYRRIEEIYSDLEATRRVLDLSTEAGDEDFVAPYTVQYNSYINDLVIILENTQYEAEE